MNCELWIVLGKASAEKNCLLSGIAQISNPPPPNSGNLVLFFSGRQNDVLRVWQEKSTDDDNDNYHDNYDSNDGNFDDYDKKNDKKTYRYYDFLAKIYQF